MLNLILPVHVLGLAAELSPPDGVSDRFHSPSSSPATKISHKTYTGSLKFTAKLHGYRIPSSGRAVDNAVSLCIKAR